MLSVGKVYATQYVAADTLSPQGRPIFLQGWMQRNTEIYVYRFIRKLAYFISPGTNCLGPIPHPLGVVTAALRSRATA